MRHHTHLQPPPPLRVYVQPLVQQPVKRLPFVDLPRGSRPPAGTGSTPTATAPARCPASTARSAGRKQSPESGSAGPRGPRARACHLAPAGGGVVGPASAGGVAPEPPRLRRSLIAL
ncbi:hypothetical protein GQ55_3G314900 [Panicum hallii var. hallii]|uniref:Uncharacterized protein n=1 Tax=Panicum hallii var. hallii TaxID=1504633 RepID=A0A2T7EF97_9POAL|nr:hypothetical protein GQ55_3G314900 [Panicum hallii var. hallii]